MRTPYRIAALLMVYVMAPLDIVAQKGTGPSTKSVLFVCEHGTARSLLAKVLFEEYAVKVGLNMTAVSRGTQADSIMPPWMLKGLDNDHVVLGSWRPQTLQSSDVANASFVVSFDLPTAAIVGVTVPRVQWDSLPSVSRDYAIGRDAIKLRVHHLVDSLKQATAQKGKR